MDMQPPAADSPSTAVIDGPPVRPPAARRAAPRAARWIAVAGAAILAGTTLFVGGFTLGRQTALTAGTPAELSAAMQPFWDAFNSIEQRYAGLPVDRRTIIEGAISGMFRALGDPFSTYLTGEEYQASLSGVSGQFQGIGAVIVTRDPAGVEGCTPAGPACRIVIARVIPGSPADRAGVTAGDAILEVDGNSVDGMTTDQVVGVVRGPRGTQVTLTLARGTAAPFHVRITRDVINPQDVTSRLMANGTVAYVRISSFGSGVAADFTSQLRTLLAGGNVRDVLLDLRGDPGGFIDQARTIASQFIASGPIYWQQSADGSRTAFDAQPGGIATDPSIHVVVLVDKETASAAEIVSGALQDDGRARLVGTTTYGKGTVQEWQLLGGNMGGFKLTIARWLTPSGRWINGRGLTPDVVAQAPASATPGSDPVLDRGLELLTGPTAMGLPAAA